MNSTKLSWAISHIRWLNNTVPPPDIDMYYQNSILYSENNVCYSEASLNLAKAKVIFGSKLNQHRIQIYIPKIFLYSRTQKLAYKPALSECSLGLKMYREKAYIYLEHTLDAVT
jgi:hypothetical protein